MSSLIERLLGVNIASKFKLLGTQQDVSELENLIHMMESVPAGRQILKDVIALGEDSVIAFVSGFANDKECKGRFHRDSEVIELVKIGTDVPEMNEGTKIRSQIMMATVLAHEIQHHIDVYSNNVLDALASNIDESVLATGLCEVSACLKDTQVNGELRAKYDRLYVYHHPEDPEGRFRVAKGPTDPLFVKYKGKEVSPSIEPLTPERKKELMKKGLTGEIYKVKKSMNLKRKKMAGKKASWYSGRSTASFRQGVEEYLQKMQIDMSFDELMACVKQSVKLLPYARSQCSDAKK